MSLVSSPHSDEVVPHLAERDAQLLARKVIEALLVFNVLPHRFGVHLDHDGMWFAAEINGKSVSARVGQGNFTYRQVARDLVLASVDPGWNDLTIGKD